LDLDLSANISVIGFQILRIIGHRYWFILVHPKFTVYMNVSYV